MSRKKKIPFQLEVKEIIKEIEYPPVEKSTQFVLPMDYKWMLDLIRRNLMARLKIEIPVEVDFYMSNDDYPVPMLRWESEAIPCETPPGFYHKEDDNDEEDEDCCDECGSPECQGECVEDEDDEEDDN